MWAVVECELRSNVGFGGLYAGSNAGKGRMRTVVECGLWLNDDCGLLWIGAEYGLLWNVDCVCCGQVCAVIECELWSDVGSVEYGLWLNVGCCQIRAVVEC